ncbi:MAG: universal stress protein [Candidatus Ranarchaeia archaeon]
MLVDQAFIQKILVSIDGSEVSIRAGEFAINIAALTKAEIFAVSVTDYAILDRLPRNEKVQFTVEDLKNKGKRGLEFIVQAAKMKSIKVHPLVVKGQPCDQLVRLAKQKKVDLIVLGFLGRKGVEKLFVDDVSGRVIEYAPCPVCVVK